VLTYPLGTTRSDITGRHMKKILLLLLVAAGGFVAYRRILAAQAEEDLWIEATSGVDPVTD
jgi:hypothetical protein